MNYDFKKLEEKTLALAKHFESDIASLRTGRATPALLENIPVEAYGAKKSLIKVLKDKMEEARISMRQIRDETWKDIQDKEKAKTISDDDKFRYKEEMEKKIKEGGDKLDQIAAKKEKEIME